VVADYVITHWFCWVIWLWTSALPHQKLDVLINTAFLMQNYRAGTQTGFVQLTVSLRDLQASSTDEVWQIDSIISSDHPTMSATSLSPWPGCGEARWALLALRQLPLMWTGAHIIDPSCHQMPRKSLSAIPSTLQIPPTCSLGTGMSVEDNSISLSAGEWSVMGYLWLPRFDRVGGW
jgi:hypothetical protein